jgi:hypothetical protein
MMSKILRTLRNPIALLLMVTAVACGGSRSDVASNTTPTPAAASNVAAVVVDGGPTASQPNVNTLYTTVTICVPGSTTQCQTIDNIQVDTGSYGLRVLASVLTLSLPVAAAADGNSLVECTQFVDGYSWGPVASADMTIAGESARSLPVQVIGSSAFSVVPDDCSSTGPAENTVEEFGANGIIGIGVFEQDCGSGCAGTADNGVYYSCSATACNPIAAPLNSQVLNPIPLFPADNNGSIIELPSVASPGAATLTGSLIFGIDTESNNASSGKTVIDVDPDEGEFTTVFAGSSQPLTASFLDTGSNGLYFNDSGIAACTDSDYTGFYCPASDQSFSATLEAASGATSTSVSFTVGNAATVGEDDPDDLVLPTLAGSYLGTTPTFDWGLPFYFGRSVATAIEQHTTSAGAGPYVAF